MADPVQQSGGEYGSKKSQEETTDAVQPTGPTTLQKANAYLFKGISYISGDMEVFGKWMKSKTNTFNFCMG